MSIISECWFLSKLSYYLEIFFLNDLKKFVNNLSYYLVHTARNVLEFTKFLCHKDNVKFDDIYDVFEKRYLEIAKNVLNCLILFLILWNSREFSSNVS